MSETGAVDTDVIEPDELIKRFINFLKSYAGDSGSFKYREQARQLPITGGLSVVIDFNDLLAFDPSLATHVIYDPWICLETASLAIRRLEEEIDKDYVDKIREAGLEFRFRIRGSLNTQIPIYMIALKHLGKLITVEGTVTKVDKPEIEAEVLMFECQRCGERFAVPQIDGRYNPPTYCMNPRCRDKGPFITVDSESRFRDKQAVRIKAPLKGPYSGRGRKRQTVDLILRDDLIDKVERKNHIRATGILMRKETPAPKSNFISFKPYISVNYIEAVSSEEKREKLGVGEKT